MTAFVLFLGHPRSGTTLLASLLDAHPEAAIAYQRDAVGLIAEGASRSRLTEELIVSSRTHAGLDRLTNGYGYAVPGQWQGRVETLRVVGDKKAAAVTERLAADPSLLDTVRRRVEVPLRVIRMVRNPFDNIATMTRKTPQLRGDLRAGVRHYLKLADGAAAVQARLSAEEFVVLRHEDLLADARSALARVCGLLGLEAEGSYLDACASIVFDTARRTRETVEWPSDLINLVAERIATDELLRGYRFAD